MRRLILAASLLLAASARAEAPPRPATADEVALFKDAMQNSKQEPERWAYTETTVMKASKGRERGETVVRFDPSKPYAEQFTPLVVEGRPPSEKDLKKYRERGERRGEKVAKAAAAATDPTVVKPVPSVRINGNKVSIDLEHPRVVRHEAASVVFEIPLVGTSKDVPIEKFQVQMRVGGTSRQLEQVVFRLKESFRVKLVAKLKAGEARMDFSVVDPKYGPMMTSVTGDFAAALMFIPVNATFTKTRTDWQRVKPYYDRLQVRLGPLEVLDL
jgi:hypothetical protein